MFCTNCGAQLPEGAKFCPYCAKPLETGQGPVQEATNANPAPDTPPFGEQTSANQAPPVQPFVNQPTPPYGAAPQFQQPVPPNIPGVQTFTPANAAPKPKASAFRWPTLGCLLAAGVIGFFVAIVFMIIGFVTVEDYYYYYYDQEPLVFVGAGFIMLLPAILHIIGGALASKRIPALVLGILGCVVLFFLFPAVFTILPLPAFIAYFSVVVLGVLGSIFAIINTVTVKKS